MRRFLLVFLTLFFVLTPSARASEYVLPYPSYMPGNAMYKVRQLVEKLQEYWYFGDMTKVKYHLKMADKYLVEAKTLFEYKQIKLAIAALDRSNYHFSNAFLYERDVVYDKKDNGEQSKQLQEAGEKHITIIDALSHELPEKIEWHEEKKDAESISLAMAFKQAALIRKYAAH